MPREHGGLLPWGAGGRRPRGVSSAALPAYRPKGTLDLAPPPMSRCFCYPVPRIKVARTTLTPWNDSMLARDHRPRIDGAPLLPCVLAAVILIVPSSAHSQAQWTSNGVPVSVLPQCGGRLPMICGDGNHGAFIAWQTDRDGNEDIY